MTGTEIVAKRLRQLRDKDDARRRGRGPNLRIDLEGWRDLYEFIADVDIPKAAGIRAGAKLALYFADWVLWPDDEWAKVKEVKRALEKIAAMDTALKMVMVARRARRVASEVLAIANAKSASDDPDGRGNAGRYQAAMVAIASAFLLSASDYAGEGDHPLKVLLADVVNRFEEMANDFAYAFGHRASFSTIWQIWGEGDVE